MLFAPSTEKKIMNTAFKKNQRKAQSAPCLQSLARNAKKKLKRPTQNKDKLLYLKGLIQDENVYMIVDTGAHSSLMSTAAMELLNLGANLNSNLEELDSYGVGLIKIIGRIAEVEVSVGVISLEVTFRVVDQPTVMIVLGLDVLRESHCVLDLVSSQIFFGGFHGTRMNFLTNEEVAGSLEEFQKREPAMSPMWTK